MQLSGQRQDCFRRPAASRSAFAAGLPVRGVKPGERVLVQIDNCPEAVIA
ncbi:MAG: hypothetical protein Q8L84_01410 [Hyphomonas sp.]|nr:hypothetical protein [Hyphomonas sp.]